MASTRTRPSARKVKYAVIGLGHIAQNAVLPAFAHATRNSTLAALISDDPEKLAELSQRYGPVVTGSYDDLDRCLAEVDAAYIALPNSMHAEFAVRCARQGVHVLCEKPMAVTEEECERMISECRESNVKLMIAYRLHFEPINMAVVELVHAGRIGAPKYISQEFSMTVKPGNIRTDRDLGGGSMYDIGVYCINAARYLFRAEPTEVVASIVNAAPDKLPEIDESTAVILRFEGERVAAFVTSFNAADVSTCRIVGTEGSVRLEPAFEYAEPLAYELKVGETVTRKRGRKIDQFAPEILHFSRCILDDREPEPSGEEGLQDVRIIRAILESADAGKPVQLPPYQAREYPSRRHVSTRPPVSKPPLVNVEAPSE